MKRYLVWCLDYDTTREDARIFEAIDHQDAVERWAKFEDSSSADYLIVGGQDANVMVAEDYDGSEEKNFNVGGWTEAVYLANELRKAERKAQSSS